MTSERSGVSVRDEEVRPILDEEIDRLPDCYRKPVILCDLEGYSYDEAARHLGCAMGTLKSRLARARERLRGRLTRRGVVPVAGGIGSLLGINPAEAAVPVALMKSTVLAAAGHLATLAATVGMVPPVVAELTEGVLKSMRINMMIKTGGFALACALAMSGAGLLAARAPVERTVLSLPPIPQTGAEAQDAKRLAEDNEGKAKAEERECKAKAEEKERKASAREKELKLKTEQNERKASAREKELKLKAEEKECKVSAREKELKLKAEQNERKASAREKELKLKAEQNERKASAREKELKLKAEQNERKASAREKELKLKAEEKEQKLKAEDKELKFKAEEKEQKLKAEEKERKLKAEEKEREGLGQ